MTTTEYLSSEFGFKDFSEFYDAVMECDTGWARIHTNVMVESLPFSDIEVKLEDIRLCLGPVEDDDGFHYGERQRYIVLIPKFIQNADIYSIYMNDELDEELDLRDAEVFKEYFDIRICTESQLEAENFEGIGSDYLQYENLFEEYVQIVKDQLYYLYSFTYFD